jgi:hypothetical protein
MIGRHRPRAPPWPHEKKSAAVGAIHVRHRSGRYERRGGSQGYEETKSPPPQFGDVMLRVEEIAYWASTAAGDPLITVDRLVRCLQTLVWSLHPVPLRLICA